MKVKTYDDMKVSLVRSTQEPAQLIKTACDLTQTKQITFNGSATKWLIKFLMDANHGSVIEHCSCTFTVTGISRSLLAQLTRHRVGSFTSASQHYADYRDMPMVIRPGTNDKPDVESAYHDAFSMALASYINLIELGEAPEEARQVLPNASAVNLLWTVNLRSLANFFSQRLCRRNVLEMRIFATNVYSATNTWFPEFIECCGPACFTHGKCDQGKMTCGKPMEEFK